MKLRTGELYFSEQSGSFSIPESISLFGLTISFYGIFLVLAALVGIVVIANMTRKNIRNREWYLMLLTITIVSALLGGRIYYVLFEWQVFVHDPVALLSFRGGGISYFGALFGSWFAVKWYCGKKNADFSENADILCLGAAASAPFVWIGCAFVREPLGRFYEGLFSVRVEAEYASQTANGGAFEELLSNVRNVRDVPYISMHPVAIYGVIFSVVLFLILFFSRRRVKCHGTVFTMYLLFNSVGSIVLEFFRADSYFVWGTGIPANYVVAGVIILTIAVGWTRRAIAKKKRKRIFL